MNAIVPIELIDEIRILKPSSYLKSIFALNNEIDSIQNSDGTTVNRAIEVDLDVKKQEIPATPNIIIENTAKNVNNN